MEKAFWFFLGFFLVWIILIGNVFAVEPTLSCSVRISCLASELAVMKMSDLNNAHAELYTQFKYPNFVCCSATGENLERACTDNGDILAKLSDTTLPGGSHADVDLTGGTFTENICLSGTNKRIRCYAAGGSCGADTALFSANAQTNSHVADKNALPIKICCKFMPSGCYASYCVSPFCQTQTPCTNAGCQWSGSQCIDPPNCLDSDNDGFFGTTNCPTGTDCNDNNKYVYSGNTEINCGCPSNLQTEACTNSVDDDCDNLADCYDSDCSSAPNCAVPPPCVPNCLTCAGGELDGCGNTCPAKSVGESCEVAGQLGSCDAAQTCVIPPVGTPCILSGAVWENSEPELSGAQTNCGGAGKSMNMIVSGNVQCEGQTINFAVSNGNSATATFSGGKAVANWPATSGEELYFTAAPTIPGGTSSTSGTINIVDCPDISGSPDIDCDGTLAEAEFCIGFNQQNCGAQLETEQCKTIQTQIESAGCEDGWDCTDTETYPGLAWGRCDVETMTKTRSVCKDGTENDPSCCQGVGLEDTCACSLSTECASVADMLALPPTERSCLVEEEFPGFDWTNFVFASLILFTFYFFLVKNNWRHKK